MGRTGVVAVDVRRRVLHEVAPQQRPAGRGVDHDAVAVRAVDGHRRVPGEPVAGAGEDAERDAVAARERGGRARVGTWLGERRTGRGPHAAERGDPGLARRQPRRDLKALEARDGRAGDVDQPAVGGQVRAETAVQRRDAVDALLPEQALQAVAGDDALHEHEAVHVGRGQPERRAVGPHVAERDRGGVGRAGRRQEPVQAADRPQRPAVVVHGDGRGGAETRPQRVDGRGIRRRDLAAGADIGRRIGQRADVSGGGVRGDRDREQAQTGDERTH